MKYRILLVEDDPTLAGTISDVLTFLNLIEQLKIVGDGKSALDVLNEETYDLMVLDLMLPVMGGLELLEHLDKTPKFHGMRVLINSTLSGGSTLRRIKACSNLHVAYLGRPFDPTLLGEKIKNLISGIHSDTEDSL
jgi:DNA-binding response OmpR family regulator